MGMRPQDHARKMLVKRNHANDHSEEATVKPVASKTEVKKDVAETPVAETPVEETKTETTVKKTATKKTAVKSEVTSNDNVG